MPAVVRPEKIVVNLKLNYGTTPSGSIKLLNMKLGDMSLTGFDAGKVLAITALLQPCLTQSIYRVEKVDTGRIASE